MPRVADYIFEYLYHAGAKHAFLVPGGGAMHLVDALGQSPVTFVATHHEQAASISAEAYSRVPGRLGCCLVTTGPGVTNALTGVAGAWIDSVPMVVITGQVPTSVMGTDAFQEVDIFGMTLSVVKHSFLVRDADDIPRIVTEAFQIAASGRPGPVLIDLPKDVANTEVNVRPAAVSAEPVDPPGPTAEAIARANELLAAARRPVLYVGGGVVLGRAIEPLREFAERTGIPTVATLKGLGALPTEHPQFLGMLGMHGTKAANLAVQGSDLLICVGARFDDRATGNLKGFAPDAAVIHLDVDAAEIGKLRKAQAAVLGDLRSSLPRLGQPGDIEGWRGYCQDLKQTHRVHYDAPGPAIHAPRLLRELSMAGGDDLIVTCDVGQHQMWAAQHCRIDHPAKHLSSSGLGAMGYGLPAAIGAQLACPDASVVAVSGDGSIMINIQELVTMRRYDLPIKIVLLDNSMLGLVRQWQDLFHDQRRSEVDLSDNPDFAAVARSMGIEAFSVDTADEVPDAIDRLLATKGPVLAHVRIDSTAQVSPLVPPGASNAVMLDGA